MWNSPELCHGSQQGDVKTEGYGDVLQENALAFDYEAVGIPLDGVGEAGRAERGIACREMLHIWLVGTIF